MDERTGLPFLSDLIFIHIGTNLRCRDLVRLACSSARFGLLRPIQGDQSYTAGASPIEHWTIVEEAARRQLRRSPMRDCIPRVGAESWLRLLRELELLQRPTFTLVGPDVVLRDEGQSAVRLSGGTTQAQQFYLQSAVCGGVDLRKGKHFLELMWVAGSRPQRGDISPVSSLEVATLLGLNPLDDDEDDDDDPLLVGVCSPSFDPTTGSMASNDMTATLYSARSGRLRQYREDIGHEDEFDWPGRQSAVIEDTIGLLLDLEEGSLAVYRNGKRCGLMVRSGLNAPLRWCVDLEPRGRTEVKLLAGSPVPTVAVCVKAQEEAAWTSFPH